MPNSVGQPLNAAFLIAVEDLVAGLARNAERLQSSAIGSPASNRLHCFVIEHSFQGITPPSNREEAIYPFVQ